jgi:hypothetical protein
MVSESLFGMLTAAGVSVLPYFLLFGNGVLTADPTISSVIFSLIFAAVPLAVAQTQVSLANGSRYYFAETWPAALTGLAGQAAVLGLYYLTGWLPSPAYASDGVPRLGGSVPLLLIGTIAVVPVLQMVVMNLAKQPKFAPMALSLGGRHHPVELRAPMVAPMFAQTSDGPAVGLQLSLLNGRF